MPVSIPSKMVCDSAANIETALHESLNNGASSCSMTAATARNDTSDGPHGDNAVPSNGISMLMSNRNGETNGNGNEGSDHEAESMQFRLAASANRVLNTKIEYEEVFGYNSSVLDSLKSKYTTLKPNTNATTTPALANGNNNCNNSPKSDEMNGRASPAVAASSTAFSHNNNNGANLQYNNNGEASFNSDSVNGKNADATTSNANTSSNVNYNTKSANVTLTLRRNVSIETVNNNHELPKPKRVLYPRGNINIGWKNPFRKWQIGSGLFNLGSTCYLNSTLQALFHVPSFANWLVSEMSHVEQCDARNQGCIICVIVRTLLATQNTQGAIRPVTVYLKLKAICKHLVVGRQEDAHEFLRYLVEVMEKAYLSRFDNWEALDQYSKETTPLGQILGGYLKTSVRCLSCNYVSVTFQHFQDLLLDIRKADTIEEALDTYFARERLEDMGYKCESCKKKVAATKQFSLERAPVALCIQLKRFTMSGTKINKHIAIKPRIDLTNFLTQSNASSSKLTYKLVSMITHLGSSPICGHYTAIGLTESGSYFCYDDNAVRPMTLQNVCNTNGYIIFYELDNPLALKNGSSGHHISFTQHSSTFNSKENCQKAANGVHPLAANKQQLQTRLIGPQLPPGGLKSCNGAAASSASTPSLASVGSSNSMARLNNNNNNNSNIVTNGGLKSKNGLPLSYGQNSNDPKIKIHFKNSPKSSNISSSSINNFNNYVTSSMDAEDGSEPEDGVSSTTMNYCDDYVGDSVAATSTLPHMPDLFDTADTSPNSSKSNIYTTPTKAASSPSPFTSLHFYNPSERNCYRPNTPTAPTPLTVETSSATKSLVPYESESDEDVGSTYPLVNGRPYDSEETAAKVSDDQQWKQTSASYASSHNRSTYCDGTVSQSIFNGQVVGTSEEPGCGTERASGDKSKQQLANDYRTNMTGDTAAAATKTHNRHQKSASLSPSHQRKAPGAWKEEQCEDVLEAGPRGVSSKIIDDIFAAKKRKGEKDLKNDMELKKRTKHNFTSMSSEDLAAIETFLTQADPEESASGSPQARRSAASVSNDKSEERPRFKRAHSTPPSPPVVTSKTGPWRVSNLYTPNVTVDESAVVSSIRDETTHESDITSEAKEWANPFGNPFANPFGNPFGNPQQTSAKTCEPLKLPKREFIQDSNEKPMLNLLSHLGYGDTTVLSWDGEKTQIEKDVDATKRDMGMEDWDLEEENDMDRGHQKKIKKPREDNRTPGYNPFQEQEEQQHRKLGNSNQYHGHSNGAESKANGTSNGMYKNHGQTGSNANYNTGHYRHYGGNGGYGSKPGMVRNKFRFSRPYNPYKYTRPTREPMNSEDNEAPLNGNKSNGHNPFASNGNGVSHHFKDSITYSNGTGNSKNYNNHANSNSNGSNNNSFNFINNHNQKKFDTNSYNNHNHSNNNNSSSNNSGYNNSSSNNNSANSDNMHERAVSTFMAGKSDKST